MADRAIGELLEAVDIKPGDLLVVEQDGSAKKLSGQTLITFLTKLANGVGGFAKPLEKIRAEGLVDTYQATYTNGQTSLLLVTNGEKGDTGAQTYVHIRYASKNPKDPPHSMGTQPDSWMGIYTGLKASAPSAWDEYAWVKIEGKQGLTGPAAVLKSHETVYQTAESGTIPPSGEWLRDPPEVLPGWYLWTRVTQVYNTGDPVISYTVGYHGINGTGATNSVAGVQPDPSGNVPLTAAHIGAATPETVSKAVETVTSIVVSNLQVPASAWAPYEPQGDAETRLHTAGKAYRASVAIPGATPTMIPYFTIDEIQVEEAGIDVVNRSRCYDGGIVLYADGVASGPITILTAELRKVVE